MFPSISRPSTPIGRITSSNVSNPPPLEKSQNPEGDTSVMVPEPVLPETPTIHLFTSPLGSTTDLESTSDEHDDFNYAMYHNHPDEAESIVSWYVDQLDSDPEFFRKISSDDLKNAFVKCQSALRHYRFQSALHKLEKKETEKRTTVEANIIKRQVDVLLQSPFPLSPNRPSSRETTFRKLPMRGYEREMTPRTSIKRSIHSPSLAPCTTKPKLRLVEKLQHERPNDGTRKSTNNDYADHIKVFSLEKDV